jgi:hypothetical protein
VFDAHNNGGNKKGGRGCQRIVFKGWRNQWSPSNSLVVMESNVEWPPTPIEREHWLLGLFGKLNSASVLQFIDAVHDAGGSTEIYYAEDDMAQYPTECKKMLVEMWNAYLPTMFKTLLQMDSWMAVDVHADHKFSMVLANILMEANAREVVDVMEPDAVGHARRHLAQYWVGPMVVQLHIVWPGDNQPRCRMIVLLDKAQREREDGESDADSGDAELSGAD